jgi:glycosyltransferase involved in cell wall biosynthesis
MSNQSTIETGQQLSNADIVIGIPAYNEAETIASVVREAPGSASEVIVVDDGSDDRTATEAREASATVISHPENQGYGAALETIFETAYERDADHLVVVDADGQHDPADATELVVTQRASEAEIVVGSRALGGSQSDTPLYRRVGLAVINTIVGASLWLGYSSPRVRDTQSGFRAYNAGAIESLACQVSLSDGMDASVDILFHAASEGYEFTEVPVDVTYDVVEANTHNPVVHGAVLVRNVLGKVFTERPLRMLGIPGAICLLFGAILASAVFTGSGVGVIPTLLIPLVIVAGSGLTGAALAIGGYSADND